jgi:Domain of unknown function (DUF4286)
MTAHAMVAYEVITIVEPDLVEAYERYMRRHHIPDLLATGCFHAAELARAAPGRYRMRYEAASQADLDRYLDEHAARLREEFVSHFPRGVTAAREVWVAIQRWTVGADDSELV